MASATGSWVASCAPGMGTVTTRRTRPRKGARIAAASFWPMMPMTRPTGLGARSSSSASVCAIAWAPAGLCAPSSHSSEPGAEQARQRAVVEPLHARRPAHLEEAALDVGIGDAERREPQRGGDGRAGVADLVLAHQRRQGQVHEPLGALIDETAALLEGLVVLAPHHERRAQLVGAGANDAQRFRQLTRDDGGHAGLQDAGLLAGDRRRACRRACPGGRARRG